MIILFLPFVGVQAGTPVRSENRIMTSTSTVNLYHYSYRFDLINSPGVHAHKDSIYVHVRVVCTCSHIKYTH